MADTSVPLPRRAERMPILPRLGLIFVILFVAFALLGPWLIPFDFRATDIRARLDSPALFGGDGAHWLGTDARGRDLLARLAKGAQITLVVAIVGTVIGAVFGSLLGFVAAACRGWVDQSIVAAIDVQASLPIIIVALFVLAMFDNSFLLLLIVIGFAGWESYARLVRGATMSAQGQGWVTAQRVLGASVGRLYLRHVLPNVANVILVQFTITLPLTVLMEAGLSFLGLGVQPPLTSLGQIMSEGRDRVMTAWWLTVCPGVLIFLLALSVSLLGDWLRDRLDPTLRGQRNT